MSSKKANATLVGQRYAHAFLKAKATQQEIEQFLDLSAVLVGDAAFEIISMTQSTKDHFALIDQLSQKLSLSQKVVNFLKIIAEKKRFGFLSKISDAIMAHNNAVSGRDFVTLTTFEAPTQAQLEQLKVEIKTYLKIEPILNVMVDPALLGGYIIETRSIMIDHSLKKRIEKLHNVMKGVA